MFTCDLGFEIFFDLMLYFVQDFLFWFERNILQNEVLHVLFYPLFFCIVGSVIIIVFRLLFRQVYK